MSDQEHHETRETTRLSDAVRMFDDPVIEAGGPCHHIMALHVDLFAHPTCGVIRCIVRREGDVHAPGFVDWSQLHELEMPTPYEATMGPELDIENAEEVVFSLPDTHAREFLGFEDPVIWDDQETETTHLYCTIPYHVPDTGAIVMYLGHAEGPDVHELTMTEPVLTPEPGVHGGAKEVAVPPRTSSGERHVLVESNDTHDGITYSVVRSATARDMGEPWSYRDVVLHPARDGHPWCAGHVSPGPMLPRTFLDVGEGRCVGLLNGREANRRDDGVTFGTFAVGLHVYDYERGEIEWLSDEPFLTDPDAESITFASAFRQVSDDRGLLYAHVDDSYVRAYEVDAEGLRSYLP